MTAADSRWARMAMKNTRPWVTLAVTYIHISTGEEMLLSIFRQIYFSGKWNGLLYSPTKAPWFQLLWPGGWFPLRQGCQDFDWHPPATVVSHEIFHVTPSSLLTYISPLTKTGLLPHTRSGWTLNIHNIDYQFLLKKKQFGKRERPQIYNVASVVSRDLKWWPSSAFLCQDIIFWSLNWSFQN